MEEARTTILEDAVNLKGDPALMRFTPLWLALVGVSLLTSPRHVAGNVAGWIIIAAMAALLMALNLTRARELEDARKSLTHLGIAIGSGLAALLITTAIRPLSAIPLVGILMILAVVGELRWSLAATLAIAIAPWWIWLAADSWRWPLLFTFIMLLPALVTISHYRDTYDWPEHLDRLLSPRAHRTAAWMLTAISGIAIILVGIALNLNKPWLALAGILLAASIPLEAGMGTMTEGSGRTSIRIAAGAFLLALCCWLAAIP